MKKQKQISKGKKGIICDSDLIMERKDKDLFDISKGFIGLHLNKKQAKDLYIWLGKQLNSEGKFFSSLCKKH